jgi:hypothetical protein
MPLNRLKPLTCLFAVALLGGFAFSHAQAAPFTADPAQFSEQEREAMQRIFSHGLTPRMRKALETLNLTVQKRLPANGAMAPQLGGFHPETATIELALLDEKGVASTAGAQTFSAVFSHELGHALLFTGVGPTELCQFAAAQGPWSGPLADERGVASLMDPILFRSHPRIHIDAALLTARLGVPNRYALRNIHEWFAEMISTWIEQRLRPERGSTFQFREGFEESLDRLFTRFDAQ